MQSDLRQKGKKVDPYSSLAQIYDYVMSHVDYKRWAKYLDTLFALDQIYPKAILDIAGGTGSMAWYLFQMGYGIAMFDSSAAMVFEAQRKFSGRNYQIPMWIGDMRRFSVNKKFEGIICNYDSMNYLLTEEEWVDVFACVTLSLSKGGLFIFDICTELNSLKNFENYKDQDSGPGFYYKRKSTYSKTEKLQTNEFKISYFAGNRQNYREVHIQRIYSLDEIIALIEKSGLETIGMFEDFTLKTASEKSERVHFVLQKRR